MAPFKVLHHVISRHKNVVVNMDAIYPGRGFELMVIKDTFRNNILWYKFVRHETVSDSLEGIEWLRSKGFRIHGIVCDGLRGLFHELRSYNVQMCQFHQMIIVRRYLTNNPELPASRELPDICYMMTRTDKESFVGMFEGWQARWEYFLNEKSKDKKTGKTSYTYKRLRSTYLSLKRNMSWLWAFYDNLQLHMPNTNNALEGALQTL